MSAHNYLWVCDFPSTPSVWDNPNHFFMRQNWKWVHLKCFIFSNKIEWPWGFPTCLIVCLLIFIDAFFLWYQTCSQSSAINLKNNVVITERNVLQNYRNKIENRGKVPLQFKPPSYTHEFPLTDFSNACFAQWVPCVWSCVYLYVT